MQQQEETIYVSQRIFACDGGKEGHPRVFLNFGQNSEIECPYCNRHFCLDARTATNADH